MDLSIFAVALQSSFVIGLIHGVNPCGHSWLVLAPFVSGETNGKRVAWLTTAFLGGTALACVVLGLSLGAVSSWIPPQYQIWVDYVVNGIIIALGVILVVKPEILHHHDHDHDHDHGHSHGCSCSGHDHHHDQSTHAHDHDHNEHGHHDHHGHGHHDHHGHGHGSMLRGLSKASAPALFSIGFVNMIIPCPTAAIMFKYAIESGDPIQSAAVFTSYAIGTAIAVGAVIWGLFKASGWLRGLEKPWLENAIMRTAGVLIAMVGVYSIVAGA